MVGSSSTSLNPSSDRSSSKDNVEEEPYTMVAMLTLPGQPDALQLRLHHWLTVVCRQLMMPHTVFSKQPDKPADQTDQPKNPLSAALAQQVPAHQARLCACRSVQNMQHLILVMSKSDLDIKLVQLFSRTYF